MPCPDTCNFRHVMSLTILNSCYDPIDIRDKIWTSLSMRVSVDLLRLACSQKRCLGVRCCLNLLHSQTTMHAYRTAAQTARAAHLCARPSQDAIYKDAPASLQLANNRGIKLFEVSAPSSLHPAKSNQDSRSGTSPVRLNGSCDADLQQSIKS